MGWLSWIVTGSLAGAGARLVTRERIGCLATIVVGIVGGLLGGALFTAAGDTGIDDFSVRSTLIAAIGATVLLFVGGRLGGRSTRRRRRR